MKQRKPGADGKSTGGRRGVGHGKPTRREFLATAAAAVLAPPFIRRRLPERGIVNHGPLRDVFAAIPQRPVDLVILYGDSNIAVGGGGWHHALHDFLNGQFPNLCFATRYMPQAENNGSGASWGVGWDQTMGDYSSDEWSMTGAGALDGYAQRSETGVFFVTDGHHSRYRFRPESAGTSSKSQGPGGLLAPTHPINTASTDLEVELLYGRAGTGYFHPTFLHNVGDGPPARITTETVAWTDEAPNATSYTKVLSTPPGTDGRNPGRVLDWRMGDPFGAFDDGVRGDFCAYYLRMRNAARGKGWSLHCIDHLGGGTAYDGVIRLQQWRKASQGDPALGLLIGKMREKQIAMGFTPMIHFIIEGIANDILTLEGGLSVNRRAPNRTPEGVLDNWSQMKAEIDSAWAALGWNPAEKTFTNLLFHPVRSTGGDPSDEARLTPTREMMRSWGSGQADMTTIDPSLMYTDRDILARTEFGTHGGYLDAGDDPDYAHLRHAFMTAMWRERIYPGVMSGGSVLLAPD